MTYAALVASEFARKLGYRGDNPEALLSALFALADVLKLSGMSFGDVAELYSQAADVLDKVHEGKARTAAERARRAKARARRARGGATTH